MLWKGWKTSNKKASGQGWLQGLNEQQSGMDMNTKESQSQAVKPWSCDDPFRQWFMNAASHEVESPVEALFDAALSLLIGHVPASRELTVVRQSPVTLPDGSEGRADFRMDGFGASLYVEIDGFPYHERAAEQASRDRARDRTMTANGDIVIRYMGSDVWRNPMACASDALSIHRKLAQRLELPKGGL